MRSKDQILKHLEDTYKESPGSYDKLIISQNVLLEILVDIRDILQERLKEIAYNLPGQTIPH